MLILLAALVALGSSSSSSTSSTDGDFVSFGVITDVHYADAAASRSRVYRDSLPKVEAAVAHMSAAKVDFMIELGDFKDTDVSKHCDKVPSPACVNLTVGFLRRMELAMGGFAGPKYHILGNHDVDILNQSIVLANEHNAPVDTPDTDGYYSWSWPRPPIVPRTADTVGCLATVQDTSNTWVIHKDSSRNWLSAPTAGCHTKAVVVPNIDVYPKRHGATSPLYGLSPHDSAVACSSNPKCTVAPPAPTPVPLGPLRFIALNGDYTDQDIAWKDLDLPFPGESWDKANVPTLQMEWLSEQLDAAIVAKQRVIVFIHYRLDGGPGGPVCTGLGGGSEHCPPAVMKNRGWVDDCTLENAAVVRALLERYPGLVLATFSGHDHVPYPPWTKVALDTPCYFTHHGLVEGHFPASNAYSIVKVRKADCAIVVEGFGNATSATIPGPLDCSLV